jgi:alkanesulfonate monooxygenase SsuD/methylene tetrahydromethanopterin reductase-like flavin-dependent oxidoreductase (luciferase family)
MAQQVVALDAIAPGRFRLGIGPSHQAAVENSYGTHWRTPLRQLREYLTVLQALFRQGSVDFQGRFVTARGRLEAPIDVPVMASALRPTSFRLCGELADGAISWMCPWDYLRDVTLPAMREGAESAGRPAPSLVAHVPVCLHEDIEEARKAAQETVGNYGRIPFYNAMFRDAGFANAEEGIDRAMFDALVAWGNREQVVSRLRTIIAEGATEIIAHPVLTGSDREASMLATMEVIAAAN